MRTHPKEGRHPGCHGILGGIDSRVPKPVEALSPDEVTEALSPEEAEIQQRLARLAWLLDAQLKIPGTEIRFGLDALIGFVPVVGDAAGAALSAYILTQAGKLGVSKATMGTMVRNIVIEIIGGLVPVIGDFFDIGFKANLRNVRLINEHLAHREELAKKHRIGFIAAAAAIWLTFAATTAIVVVLLLYLLGAL